MDSGSASLRYLLVAVLTAYLLVDFSPARAVELDKKGPAIAKVRAKDWLRHPHDDSYYTESWTTILRSKQGHVVFITFLYSNIGVFAGSTGVSVSLAMPGKKARHYVWDYATGQYAQDAKSGRVAIASHFMSARNGEVFVRIKEKDLKMDITLQGWTAGVKFHDGMMYLDDQRSKWLQFFVHVPRGKATGVIEADGEKIAFDGDGYMDHWVQNVLGSDYSTHWWTARLFHPAHTVILMVVKLTKEYGGKRFARLIVTDRKKVLLFDDSLALTASREKSDPKGHKYARHYEVKHSGKRLSLAGSFAGDFLFDREAILDRMNAAQKQIVKMVAGNPVIYRMTGTGNLKLEVKGAETILKGPAIMESIVLGDDE